MEKILDKDTCWIKKDKNKLFRIRFARKEDSGEMYSLLGTLNRILLSNPDKKVSEKLIENEEYLVCDVKNEKGTAVIIAISRQTAISRQNKENQLITYTGIHPDFRGLEIYPALITLMLAVTFNFKKNSFNCWEIDIAGNYTARSMRTLNRLGEAIDFDVVPEGNTVTFYLIKKRGVKEEVFIENCFKVLSKDLGWEKTELPEVKK